MFPTGQPEQRPPDARSVLDALEPKAQQTAAHEILQRRVASAERRTRTAEAATEQQRRNADLRERGRASLRVLFEQLGHHVRQGRIEPEVTEAQNAHFLTVADARLAAVLVGDAELDDPLTVVELRVHNGEGSDYQLVANMVLDAPGGIPRWRVVRWSSNDISPDRFEPGPPRQAAGLPFDKLTQQWRRQTEPIPPLIREFSEATPDGLLNLFTEALSDAPEA